MIIEGIMSIQSGDNPRIVEHKLSVFLSPKSRPSTEEREAA
jgi:chemotaxis protein MotA